MNSVEDVMALNEGINAKNKVHSNILYLIIKRLFDILGALIGLLFLLPIALIVKICYLCSKDTKSIFYSQDRIGKDGKLFRLYKFRSMVPNADIILSEILRANGPEAEEYRLMKKITNDPRITPVGKFIRKFSIDELPQLINILKGDMSFIGNRPYLPGEKIDMGNYYDIIVMTKPGLTGYWQVNLRSRGTFEDRLKLEEYYSKHYSLGLDIKIFFKTFSAVFSGKDAK